jgi:hypothetical protein
MVKMVRAGVNITLIGCCEVGRLDATHELIHLHPVYTKIDSLVRLACIWCVKCELEHVNIHVATHRTTYYLTA